MYYVLQIVPYHADFGLLDSLVFYDRIYIYTFTRKLPSEINIALTSNNIKLRDCQPGDFDTSPTSQIAENGLTEL